MADNAPQNPASVVKPPLDISSGVFGATQWLQKVHQGNIVVSVDDLVSQILAQTRSFSVEGAQQIDPLLDKLITFLTRIYRSNKIDKQDAPRVIRKAYSNYYNEFLAVSQFFDTDEDTRVQWVSDLLTAVFAVVESEVSGDDGFYD